MHIPAWDFIGCLLYEYDVYCRYPRKPLTSLSFLSDGLSQNRSKKKKKGLIRVLGFHIGFNFEKPVRQFGGGEMIQDAKNPM